MLKEPDEFLRQDITYGIILLGSLEQIQEFKETILHHQFKVVFQKTSLGRLRIIEDTNHESEKE
jgi:hypothetical protein